MLAARLIAAIVIGYLLGSISFGAIIARIYKGVDIRRYGSGRTGATNVLRTLGPGAAAAVAVGDVAKGAVAVLIAILLFQSADPAWRQTAEAVAGIAAIAGHNWSVLMHWTGGRGVLVAGGALLALFPAAFVACAVTGFIVIALTRFVSLGSLVAVIIAALAILVAVALGDAPPAYAAFALVGGGIIVVQHRDNIERLRSGTERKLGQRVAIPPPNHGTA